MVGREATEEMNAYHSGETIEHFSKWKIGRIDYQWKNLLPPIQGGVYKSKSEMNINCLETKNERASYGINFEALSSSSSTMVETFLNLMEKEDHGKGIGFPKEKVTPRFFNSEIIPNRNNKDTIYPVQHTSKNDT